MNPRTDFEAGDTVTTRAYFTLFRKCGDVFQYAIDGTPDDAEVRGYLTTNPVDSTTIGITAINQEDKFRTLSQTLTEMGLTVEEEIEDEKHESIGEYTAYTLQATAEEDLNTDWNVPHLAVYGSLSPEIEDACYDAFGTTDAIQFENVRNHFLVFGKSLPDDAKAQLSDAVSRSSQIFEDQKQDIRSDIHTADFV